MGKFVVDKRSACDTRKRGFTLMELMVYIAIVGIVVIVAGQAFSNSTKMRVRTQSMLKASEVAENVAALFKQDVAQTGAKSSLETHATDGSNDTFSGVKKAVYMDPDNDTEANRDSSSFQFVPASPASNENLEQFKMRRVRYSDAGAYEAVEEITWFLEGNVLKRRCVVVDDGDAGTDCAPKGASGTDLEQFTVEMATDVDSFKVLPAIPDGNEGSLQMFPSASGSGAIRLVSRTGIGGLLPVVPGDGGTSVQLTGFASNYDENSDEPPAVKSMNEVYVFENSDVVGTWKSLCESASNHFSFEPGQEYELSFGVGIPTTDTEKAKMFVPGKDHMAVGFRNSDGEKFAQIPDFMFYPPSISEANGVRRSMRFSVPSSVTNACLAFTFSFYSPLASTGTLMISDLRLKKIASSTYSFNSATTSVALADKKNVKAFQLRLKVKRNGESGEVSLLVPTPSNGPTD
ncbi:prepilin-type N-terminal cleavage/methylation domain-containing protein [Fibrobacter sp. UBA2449]|uniref:prepilin-type N-terminal cleavage/methylation domain-containing protein n=1 Tax=Fibrobacter sp. UBA2449 TaxID=1946529 RepID=UPI0025BA6B0A|nr:prepilin-type N-terminal cleavage/methylation domain-containing protein [Fibrobacter sp. UBA2449]